MDADANELWLVAIARSEDAYRAFSESQESHEVYVKRLRTPEAPPEWHDGSLLEYRTREAPEEAKLYGTIGRLQVKPGGADALWATRADTREPDGAVALFVFQKDADPHELYLISISESEAAHRACSESPESREQFSAMRAWPEAERKWHDGRVLRYETK
jgi:heme-degrading monooxygenase HmoA